MPHDPPPPKLRKAPTIAATAPMAAILSFELSLDKSI
jgi:hypothetical protein